MIFINKYIPLTDEFTAIPSLKFCHFSMLASCEWTKNWRIATWIEFECKLRTCSKKKETPV